MWSLWNPFPPIGDVTLTMRELVAAGMLVQRELVPMSKFIAAGRNRGIHGLERETLQRWDRDGLLSPVAFVRGGWVSWSTTEPYPTEGIYFRQELGFKPWTEYEFERYGHPEVNALYSEWQLLYLPIADESNIVRVPAVVAIEGPSGPLRGYATVAPMSSSAPALTENSSSSGRRRSGS
jgi:hypothetical protein